MIFEIKKTLTYSLSVTIWKQNMYCFYFTSSLVTKLCENEGQRHSTALHDLLEFKIYFSPSIF